MQVSTFSRYGLRAIIRLAILLDKEDKPVSVKKIAEQENISLKYLENIFSMLRKNDLVLAVRGKFGGYKLNKQPAETTVYEIIEALEGRIAPTSCVVNQAECINDPTACTAFPLWTELNNEIEKVLKNRNLGQMVEDYRRSMCGKIDE